jgi:hypothetical protein
MAPGGLACQLQRCRTQMPAAGSLHRPAQLAAAIRTTALPRGCRARWPVRIKSDDEAGWDTEMSIFTQRTMRPNQLETLRELEAKVNVGKARGRRSDTRGPSPPGAPTRRP